MNDTAPPQSGWLRWWLPSLGIGFWLVLFLGLNLSGARHVLISADSDPCLHWRLGNWMIEHRAIVRVDPLLHTRAGAPVITKEWLSEVVFAAAGNLAGWSGIILLASILIATFVWLFFRQLFAETNDALLATGMMLLAMTACSMHWLARPHLFTHLLTLVFAWQLRWHKLGRVADRSLLLWLPALMVFWVNLHGAFLTGLVLVGMCLAGEIVSAIRQGRSWTRAKILFVLFVACLLASLVNPNTWKLHAHIVKFLGTPGFVNFTTEFMSPDFHASGMNSFALVLLVLAVTMLTVRPRLDATDFFLVGGWGYFALQSARNVPLFAIVVTPILAQWIAEGLTRANDSMWRQFYRGLSARLTGLQRDAGGGGLAMLALVAVVFAVAKPALVGGAPWLVNELPADKCPTGAFRFIREHPEKLPGEMFNKFVFGGYVELHLPDCKPFIDSRNDAYGPELAREYIIVAAVEPGWEEIFAKYKVGWTLLPPWDSLNQLLALHPDWTKVYADEHAVIYANWTR